jgi:hypothetical protein
VLASVIFPEYVPAAVKADKRTKIVLLTLVGAGLNVRLAAYPLPDEVETSYPVGAVMMRLRERLVPVTMKLVGIADAVPKIVSTAESVPLVVIAIGKSSAPIYWKALRVSPSMSTVIPVLAALAPWFATGESGEDMCRFVDELNNGSASIDTESLPVRLRRPTMPFNSVDRLPPRTAGLTGGKTVVPPT